MNNMNIKMGCQPYDMKSYGIKRDANIEEGLLNVYELSKKLQDRIKDTIAVDVFLGRLSLIKRRFYLLSGD